MRIVHISAGPGAMYCGACARDATLVRGLLARGHDVTVIPLYLPLRVDDPEPLPVTRVHLSGINAYLQQVCGIFRHTPRWVDWFFENRALLKFVSHFAIETRPARLGPMTVSVLSGREGRQRKEVEKLMEHWAGMPQPDVVGLTSPLLSALAVEIKTRFGLPVACALQGEDSFVQVIPEPHRSQVQEWMRRNARAVDVFMAPSSDHGARMREFLGVPPQKVRVILSGIDGAQYKPPAAPPSGPFRVGYLSIIVYRKGLDLLVDAFIRLARDGRRDLRLAVAGKIVDRSYWAAAQRRLREAGLAERCEYVGEPSRAGKIALMQSCHAFVVPSRIEESRGLVALEALACGSPVVVPDVGAFPEILRRTGGGVSFRNGDAESLAQALAQLADDPAKAAQQGRAGAEGIQRDYSAARMVEETLAAYQGIERLSD